jgi:hypothetical protein
VSVHDAFFPLSRIADERRVDAVPASVVRTLRITDTAAAGGLAQSIHEIVRNAEEHSRSLTPAAFCAGWFRTQKRATFAVADNGIGEFSDTSAGRGWRPWTTMIESPSRRRCSRG